MQSIISIILAIFSLVIPLRNPAPAAPENPVTEVT